MQILNSMLDWLLGKLLQWTDGFSLSVVQKYKACNSVFVLMLIHL